MEFQLGRSVVALATLIGLVSVIGCGDPCLDDGRGKGQCFAQSGSDTTSANTTTEEESAESLDVEASAEGQEAEAGDGCENMTQDNGETDVDCGGPCVDEANDTGQCENGQGCLINLDCISDNCEAGTCVPPEEPEECSNGMQGGTETDVDCGGECVADPGDPENPEGKCDNGDLCEVDGDCVSNFCDMGQCAEPPDGCFNMMSDPGETDVDCGGDCVEDPNDPNNDDGKCLPGETCLIGSDCTTELCVDGLCEEDPCADMQQNNDETDVDCGGGCVIDPNDPNNPEGKCDEGEGCLIDGDCVSNVCDPNMLVCLGLCENMQLDPGESDVDCGGDCVEVDPNNENDIEGQCGPGEACLDDVDCVAGNCIADACDVCAPVEGYSSCALCLVGGCCDAVTACLLDVPKCVCWFNCISEPGSTVQACMDECGNGNIGMIQSCVSNTCNQECV